MFYKYTDSYIVIHIVISCSVLVNIIKDINSAPQISHVHFLAKSSVVWLLLVALIDLLKSYKSTSRWDWYSWGPLLIGGGVVGRCCRVAEWPASVGWRFSDIGNWFPDIGKSSTFPDIGKSISDIRKSFPDIGKSSIISRYRKLISRYREFQFPISGNNSRYREMLNKNPNGFRLYPDMSEGFGVSLK